MGRKFLFGKMKKVLAMGSGRGCPTMWMCIILLKSTFKNGYNDTIHHNKKENDKKVCMLHTSVK